MNRQSILSIIVSIGLLLGGCSSSPPVRYFTLQPLHDEGSQNTQGALTLAIGPLSIPQYLDRSQIVRRGPGAELLVDDFNRWAEPMEDAIQRIVAANVDSLVEQLRVVAFPYHSLLDADYRLVGRVDRLDTDISGLTLLQVQWSLVDDRGRSVLPPRRDRYESRLTGLQTAEAIARSINDVLAQFSQEIAGELSSIKTETPPAPNDPLDQH